MIIHYLESVIKKYNDCMGKSPAYIFLTDNQFEKLKTEIENTSDYKESNGKFYYLSIELIVIN